MFQEPSYIAYAVVSQMHSQFISDALLHSQMLMNAVHRVPITVITSCNTGFTLASDGHSCTGMYQI